MATRIANNRWAKQPGEFAIRLGEKDLSGLFSKRIVIEEGTAGLLMVQGRFDKRLEPGQHVLEGGIGAILGGKDRKSIVLVSLGEIELEFNLFRLLTKDPIPFSVQTAITLRFSSGREAIFLSNLMLSRDTVGLNELKDLAYSELRDGAQEWADKHSIKELAQDLSLRGELAMSLESHMRPVLDRYGIAFGRLEVNDFKCEIWDKSVNARVETSLQVTQAQAQLEGRKRLFDVAVEKDIQDLTEETQKAATYEKRIQLWERMQRAANLEQMNKIKSERDLEDFIRQADREKLLKEDDFERFKVALKQAGEDKERLRAHLVRIAQMEQEYDLRRKEVAQQAALSREQAEGEIGLERLRMEGRLEMELKRVDMEVERQRREAEFKRQEEGGEAAARWERELGEAKKQAEVQGQARETRRLDAELALALDEKVKAQERLHQQEQARAALDRQAREQELGLKAQEAQLELRLRELRERHQQELSTMQAMSGVSIHALIAVAPGEKAPLLAELARTEALKSLSPEQILAIASEKSPQLGGALAEMAAKGGNEQVKTMYERILSEQKESATQVRESQREMTRVMQEMFNKALETQSQVSQAFARGGGQPGPAQVPAAAAPGGQPQRVVICRRCFQESPVGTKHCPNCGESLMAEPR